MSADKRSVSTDALETLGTIIDESAGRDAIHVAVEPVQAGQRLFPGADVCIVNGRAVVDGAPLIGIVDPFLKRPVNLDEWFWMLLYPRTITSLRHVWSHPAFDDLPLETISREDHLAKSNAWIQDHAEFLDITVNQLLRAAEGWLEAEDYTVQEGSEYWRDYFNSTEFWHHYEVITGTVVPEDKKQSFFCCHC